MGTACIAEIAEVIELVEPHFFVLKESDLQPAEIPQELLIIRDLYRLVEHNFKKQRKPGYYSEQIGLSTSRLDRLSLQYLGYTVYEYVQQRTHQEALDLLRNTMLSSKQIAYELGLCDPGYFCRCFKRLMGISPKAYRLLYLSRENSAD